MSQEKAIVLGLDGLSWNVIEEMLEEGNLPNIKEIIEKGASGKLKPEPPVLSPLIWTSIFTGKKPEKHGIKDFFTLGKDLKADQIWDILKKRDFRIGAYRPWSGWDVKNVDGFFIPGFFSFQDETQPEGFEFVTKLDKKARMGDLDSTFLLQTFFKLTKFLSLGKAFEVLKKSLQSSIGSDLRRNMCTKKEVEMLIHTSLFLNLLKKEDPDFTVFYENSCDFISHRYWKDMDTDSKLPGPISRIYEKLDEFIGEVRDYAEERNIHLVVVSDHGFKQRKDPEKAVAIKIPRLLEELGLSEDVYGMNVVETSILRPKPESSISLKTLENKIRSFKHEGGEIFNVERKEDRMNFMLKDSFKDKENYRINTSEGVVNLNDIIVFGSTKKGVHCEENGVFIIKGPKVREGVKIGDLKPWDVTPTLLTLFEEEIPSGADGRVLKDVFKENPQINYFEEEKDEETNERNLREEEEKYVKEKLKYLGYL